MDSATQHCLPITGCPLPECDIDAPIVRARRHCLDYITFEYENATRASMESGHEAEAKLYHSLAIICSFASNFDSIAEPYQPRMPMEGRRGPVPDDLTQPDLEIIAQLISKTASPLLRARFKDLLWVKKRDHLAASSAVNDYVQSANLALTKEDWLFATRFFQRAMQLGHRLGRKNEPWQLAERSTVAALDLPLIKTEPYLASHILGVLEKMGAGDFASLAEKAKGYAEGAVTAGDPNRARAYYDHEAAFWSLAKDSAKEEAARLASAMTYEAEAELALKRAQPSYMVASSLIAQGIEALRRAHADAMLVERLKGLLRKFQRESRKEMGSFSQEVDLSKAAEQAAKIVTHEDLMEAIKHLAFCRPLASRDAVEADMLKLAKDFPISHIFPMSMVDEDGRVKAHVGGIHVGGIFDASETEQKAIEARTYKHAAEWVWRFRAAGFIEPARRQIWSQHLIQQDDLNFLVLNNPFVPPGHEGIFRRGIYYGLCGDMLLAAHLLAPQVENSIRYVLEQNGADVSNLQSDLTQPVKTLGPLLELPETKSIFGEDYIFEFKGLLIEKLGYSFRHRVAHGFVTESSCYGPECSNLWWLVIRLCCTPYVLPAEGETEAQAMAEAGKTKG